ncbi:MAG: dihydrodipicolinate synthase family protein [Marmoricola sp.]|nr:dihydrodipicolinate synthase family protein [Marmoricola sp.]
MTWTRPAEPIRSRVAYAAAHVVAHAHGEVDWEHTLAFRHELWSWGLGVADAMDTAQRGMGLDWPTTRELIERSAAEARSVGGALVCGAGTDQLDTTGPHPLTAVTAAYVEQIDVVEAAGATVVVMASRALAAAAAGPDDYLQVYDEVLSQVDRPVILHWLGPMFDPALAGYWGSADLAVATKTFVELVATHADRVDGVKVSLLDAEHEIALRSELPAGVRLYTGDDYHYPDLIIGDGTGHSNGGGHSDALLGIFAAIYPAASTALQRLDAGDDEAARAILASTQELSRHVFAEPTRYYKTGIAFLSWLNGHQPTFTMLGGLETMRSHHHLRRTYELAGDCDLLLDPDLAEFRMRSLEAP